MSDSGNDAVVMLDNSVRDAGEPFAAAEADIILRSSDNVDFRAHRAFLKYASPVFTTMFTLPGPPAGHGDEEKDGLTVVRMTEDEKAIRLLLSFCYPGMEPNIDSLKSLSTAVQIAAKFEIALAQPAIRSAVSLLASRFPERVYALGWTLKSRELVLSGARESLKVPLLKSDRLLTDIPEFHDVSGHALQQLLAFQKRCLASASHLHTNMEWIKHPELPQLAKAKNQGGVCSECTYRVVRLSDDSYRLKYWAYTYISQVAHSFQRGIDLDTLTLRASPSLLGNALVSPCSHYGGASDFVSAIDDLNTMLKTRMEAIMSEAFENLKTPF